MIRVAKARCWNQQHWKDRFWFKRQNRALCYLLRGGSGRKATCSADNSPKHREQVRNMSSLLNPNAAVAGLPQAVPNSAPSGFFLGDHAQGGDPLEADFNPHDVPRELGPRGRRFEPYVNNGGTVVSVSGKDYTIVASDTRYGLGYSVPARYVSRVIKLTDKIVLASSGMQADIITLHKVLRIRLAQYFHANKKELTLEAASQMLSNMLYYRRFQPYYTFNVLGGIDQSGTWVLRVFASSETPMTKTLYLHCETFS